MNEISNCPNIDPKTHQNEILIRINKKDFSNAPNYSNGLNKDNINISPNNKLFLEKLINITKYSLVTPLEILYKEQYNIFKKITNERDKCPICLCEFYDDIITDYSKDNEIKDDDFEKYYSHEIDTILLSKCEDHFYHIECLINYIQGKNGFKCAICQKIYGVIMGIMPSGTMKARLEEKIHCNGHPNVGTIIIEYNFKGGVYNGQHFTGTQRRNYIPNSEKGRLLLGLLKIAFDRKLTFTIGTSVTTGVKNTIVWNGIHHKSSLTGGATHYGYPDPTYFNRVCEELAAKGVNRGDYEDNDLEFLASNLMYGS